jgi:chemotaxis protein MotA
VGTAAPLKARADPADTVRALYAAAAGAGGGGRVDFGVVGGLLLAVGALLGADLMDGGSLAALINPSAAVLILGGTLGATAVASRFEDFLSIPALVLRAVRPPRIDLAAEIERMVALALKARRQGLLSLEEDIAHIEDPFVARGLQMVVDGADADSVRSVLRTEMALRQQRALRRAGVFEAAGGFAPTMGIIGTVLGLIHVLANLADASKLGPSIATAFLATFYGITTANVFWLPIGSKLKQIARLEGLAAEVALEGLLSIQAGDNPSAVRDKLAVFLQGPPPRPQAEPAQPGGASGAEAPAEAGRGRVA